MEWLGEVPHCWDVKKVKNIFHLIVEPAAKNNQCELLSVYTDIGVKPRAELEERGNKASTTDGYWIVKKGDIVVNKLLAWMGAIGLSEYDGVTSPAYDILRPHQQINGKFFHYLFRTPLCLSEFKKNSRGIMDMRLRLYFEELGNIYIPFPSYPEQQKIAQFLDDKTAKIDQAVDLVEKQIALLKEHKQILIQNAVTRGLNPDVPLKDSGVEWIGKVQEHWEVKKIKAFAKINNGLDYKAVIAEEGYPVYGSGGQFAYANTYLYDGEAVLLGRKGTIDKPLYINDKFWTVDTMFYSVCNNKVSTKFFYYCCCSIIPFQYYSTSTALPSMTQSDILNHKVTFPSLKEQYQIADYLDKQTAKIDQAIALKTAHIEKLKEYKSVLINDVVTGKVRV
ncbi:TPA: restriction endonuclease subunit S [Neisseria subflava]